VPSLVAAARGAEVTATDWADDAIALVRENAAANGVELTAEVRDWREPWDERFDLVLAADVLYERRNVAPLVARLAELAPVALIARSFNIVVVNAKSPYRSIGDLIAAAKAEPDKLSYGTYGTGTSAHLAGELFKSLAKVNLTMVPYKGAAPAITDLLGGQIQVMFTTVASAASLIEGGQLRALAVTSAERSPAFPDVPTVAEAGVPGYSAESWYGLFAPAKTPPEIIECLNKSTAAAVKAESFRRLSVSEGLVMVASPPAELDRYFRGEEARWRKVIQDAGIKIE